MEAIEFLKNYNLWRRGDESIKQSDPVAVGQAIDSAVAEIQELRKVAKAAENLIKQKGRHNTEIAYLRLSEVLSAYKLRTGHIK